jgi:P-type Ca2+ transporter type 2C
MGSGTDVAKDAASMIVTDDRFSSIVAGIEEGRFAYGNVRKVTLLLVATGAAEVLLFTFALVANLPIPLFAVQLLWLNLVTEGVQHIGLAFEPGSPARWTGPPGRRSSRSSTGS